MDIDKGFDLSCAEAFYREDYIEHKRGVKAASFDELIRALGEPLDDEELDMLAARVHEIICRRMSLEE